MDNLKKYFVLVTLVCGLFHTLWASKLIEMKVVDKDYLMLDFQDAEVKYVDDGKGPGAYGGHESGAADNSYVVTYGEKLDLMRHKAPR